MRGKPITEAEGNQILRALAEAVAETHEDHPAPAGLLRNPQELDRYIRQVKVDWHTIASGLSMEKGKVYTWYFNTWSNKVLGARMTPTDKEIIRSEIRRAIQEGTPIDKEFRKNIYNKLSTTYHTLEVSCHVTNYINSREAKALMEQCHFYVEKLSKHRAAAAGGPVMDSTATHPLTPPSLPSNHEFDAQQQSSLAATGLGNYKTRPDSGDACPMNRYAQSSCDAGVGDSDDNRSDDDDREPFRKSHD
ncbi:hypothetical protein GMRT_12412 [Giardia muris]|uniref:Uncharacterized protein n=1 Tax=Giardia muris TaxID=5742 RepID=A0A4Z1T487_GIAMU|nr:hypothetical protein GMRT_12412 [Giardia muris]|eukprot:TNJ27231.1 hypothetical protein GMRT_12412 [Giardia muris]